MKVLSLILSGMLIVTAQLAVATALPNAAANTVQNAKAQRTRPVVTKKRQAKAKSALAPKRQLRIAVSESKFQAEGHAKSVADARMVDAKSSGALAPIFAQRMDATATTTVKASDSAKPWSARASGEFYAKHRRDHDAYAVTTLDLNYKFDDLNSARILQSATKYTVVPQGDAEFLLDDTTIQYTRVLIKDWNGFGVRVRPGLSLPVSRESGKQGIVSRPSVSLPIARKFIAGKVSTSYTPFYRYQINRFQTRISGAPLRKHSLGHTLALSYSITEKFAASVTGQGQYNWDEQSPYAKVDPRPKGNYIFDSGLSYAFNENFEIGAGFAQSDGFIREGRYDVNVYDPSTSRYYLTLSAAL